MDLSHNLRGIVRNSVYAVISTYFLKYLDLISIDWAEYIASLTMQGGKLTEIPETFSLPNTITIPMNFNLYGPPGQLLLDPPKEVCTVLNSIMCTYICKFTQFRGPRDSGPGIIWTTLLLQLGVGVTFLP